MNELSPGMVVRCNQLAVRMAAGHGGDRAGAVLAGFVGTIFVHFTMIIVL